MKRNKLNRNIFMIAEKLNGVKSIYIYSLTRSNQIYEYEYIYYYSADMTDMSVRDKMKEKKNEKKNEIVRLSNFIRAEMY